MNRLWTSVTLTMALLLGACGGGGGGGGGNDAPATRAALPALAQSAVPAGPRIDLRASNFFPMNAGDVHIYSSTQNGVTTPAAVTQGVSVDGLGQLLVTESDSTGTSVSTYQRTADGLLLLDPVGDALGSSARALIGAILEFAEPFYPVGETRRIIRQGPMDIDLDGDGINDSFRLEFTQVYHGLTPVTLPDATQVEAAHITSVVALTLSPSSLVNQPATLTITDSTWWGPGIGMVRAERSVVDSQRGVLEPPRILEISAATVGGTTLFQPTAGSGGGGAGTPSASGVELLLTHNALVFDSGRRLYYASVPGSVVGRGNSIAIISADTGAVTYSAPIGSEPSALALDATSASLYVGLNGSGEVIRLALPDLTELSRTRLPVDSFFGQLYAEKISVSPTAAGVAAVSTFRAGVSPRHGGVVLLRDGVLQALKTQEHTGSNLIVFGSDGQTVYGYNNETTEFGLRRIDVLTDGLRESLVVSAGQGFGGLDIDRIGTSIVLGRSVYRQSDLLQLGSMSVAGGCRPLPDGLRLLCNNTSGFGSSGVDLAVVDSTTFVIRATARFNASLAVPGDLLQIVPGPDGQAALRLRDFSSFAAPATGLRLVDVRPLVQAAAAQVGAARSHGLLKKARVPGGFGQLAGAQR